MDRWLLSREAHLVDEVRGALDAYDLTRAARRIGDFVVDDLSNWYIRRGRDRFWGSTDAADTASAFQSLWEAIVTVSRLMAPFTPFLSDWLHRAVGLGAVHLAPYPEPHDGLRNADLERGMDGVRSLASLGRAAREQVQIRVRQPLGTLYAVAPHLDLSAELRAVLEDELNVKAIEFVAGAEELVTLEAKPNFRTLGQRFGSHTQDAAAAIRALGSDALAAFGQGEEIVIEVDGESHDLKTDDLEIIQVARGDLVVESGDGFTVALDPAIDEDLRLEGLARELVNRTQRLRRDAGLEVSDRIDLWVSGDPAAVEAATRHGDYIAGETLATALEAAPAPEGQDVHGRDITLDDVRARIALRRAEGSHGPEG
jgi:isoleucyl-tRNA synthetase